MQIFLQPEVWQPALWSFVAAALGTPVVRVAANRLGAVAAPKEDRWHSRPTALLGGVAIFAVAIPISLMLDPTPALRRAVLPASALLFAVGLIDDIVNLKPHQKLVGQIIGAGIVINAGLVLPWTSSSAFNSAITMFWLVGITNAVNMIDNMDGLAAGVAFIASLFLALNVSSLGQIREGTILIVLAAALFGFLLYNSPPASIFMGDCGSMFIGFFLASMALLSSTSVLPFVAGPVLILAVPIFDASFVILVRKLSGRAASQGGRDHTSHRLVALGLTERHAVWLLWAVALISGFLSTQLRGLRPHETIVAIFGVTICMAIAGIYLGGVRVYPTRS